MFYLPRICEHCLNPSCVASCPSGAMYKREEDGIVLVDQDRCRGWRFCVSGCPYKKVYFNHRTGKAEKCTLCFPRIEVGQPTDLLRDLRRAAALPRPGPLRRRQGARRRPRPRTRRTSTRRSCRCSSTPRTPRCAGGRRGRASRDDWIEAARRSPVYALASAHKVALPLHPEYRTLPMVWYVPPLSPVADVVHAAGYDDADPDEVFASHRLAAHPARVPGQPVHRRRRRRRCAGCCASSRRSGRTCGPSSSGWRRTSELGGGRRHDRAELDDLYRLLAIAKYDDRYVIPKAHAEDAGRLMAQHEQMFCSLDTDGGPAWAAAADRPAQSFHPAGSARQPDVPRRRRARALQPARLGRPRATRRTCSRPRHLVTGAGARPPVSYLQAGLGAAAVSRPPALFEGRRRSSTRSPACPRASRRRSRRSWPGCGRRRRRRSRSTTSRPSTCAAAARCTSPTTATATPASAGWRCSRFKTAYRRARFAPTERRAARLPAAACSSSPRSPPRPGSRSCAAAGPIWSCCAGRCDEAGSPYAHVVEAVCAELPKLRKREQDLVRDALGGRPPARGRWPGTVRAPRISGHGRPRREGRHGEHGLGVLLVGHPALRRAWRSSCSGTSGGGATTATGGPADPRSCRNGAG